MRFSDFPRAYHDIGGDPADRVAFEEEPWEYWEKECEAMRSLLGDGTRRLVSLDELRHAIESFGEEKYNRPFYERRLLGMIDVLASKGIVDPQELAQRVAALRERLANRP
jgi:nitrile hydratase subunit beta